jgi:hypothetical protein
MPQTAKNNDSHETRMRHDLMGFSVDRLQGSGSPDKPA